MQLHYIHYQLTMQVSLIMSSLSSHAVMGAFSDTGPFPATYAMFSSDFKQPPIPSVKAEFRGHFIQHKW